MQLESSAPLGEISELLGDLLENIEILDYQAHTLRKSQVALCNSNTKNAENTIQFLEDKIQKSRKKLDILERQLQDDSSKDYIKEKKIMQVNIVQKNKKIAEIQPEMNKCASWKARFDSELRERFEII